MTTVARKPLPIDRQKSKLWAMASLGSSGVGTFGLQLFDLVNRETHRAHRMAISTGGIGLGPPFSASFGASDYVNFTATRPVDFFDFHGTRMTVRETNVGLYSWTTVSFWGMSVKISGGGLNIPGLGVSQGDVEILFSDGRAVGSPDLEVNMPPIPIGPEPTKEFGEGEEFLVSRIRGDLLFGFDKYLLNPGQRTENALIHIGQRLDNVGKRKFLVVGHTDSIGSNAYNLGLSKRRAETVANWLTQHNYVMPQFIKTHGEGESDPIASNDTEEGRAENRRVEVLSMVPRVWDDY